MSKNVTIVVGLFVMLGWATFAVLGPRILDLGSWDRSNCNLLWSGLCTNYALFAKNMPMAGRATLDELWQADMIRIIKESTFAFRQSE